MEQTKKKILLAITKSNFGGAQRYVYDIATHLDPSHFSVKVLAGGNGVLQEKLSEKHIPLITLPEMERDINILKECRSFFSLVALLKKERPDVLHLNSSKMGGLGSLAGRIAGVPHIIFTVHGWYFNENRPLFIKTLTYLLSWVTALLSHTIITVSKKDLAQGKKMPFVKHKMVLSYPGISPTPLLPRETARDELTDKKELHRDDFWLGTIAEFTKNKNIPEMVRAVASFNKEHTQKIFFLIIGNSGEEKERVTSLIKTLNAEAYIIPVGFKPGAARLLSAFDGFILASQKEGLPYVLLEAGVAKLPVLASSVGGIPELIEDKNTGFLLTHIDHKSIEAGLVQLLEATPNISEALYEKVHASFSLSKMISTIKTLYSHL